MAKPTCVRSTAVKVCQDELMTELLRRFPAEQLAAALQGAHDAARKRFVKSRHNRYKGVIFFKHLAERLPDLPDLLGVTLGLIDPEQVKLPGVGTEDAVPKHCKSIECQAPAGCYCGCMSCGTAQSAEDTPEWKAKLAAEGANPYPILAGPDTAKQAEEDAAVHDALEALGQPEHTVDDAAIALDTLEVPRVPIKADQPTLKLVGTIGAIDLHTEMPVSLLKLPPETKAQRAIVEDEYARMIKVPKFDDYEAVFAEWPYIWETMLDGERVLALGYLSGRDEKNNDALVRRNCAYSYRDTVDKPFKGLVSVVGLLKKTVAGGTRLHVKVIPYRPGAKVRFWTNVRGEGDREEYNRYRLLSVNGLVDLKTRRAYDNASTG